MAVTGRLVLFCASDAAEQTASARYVLGGRSERTARRCCTCERKTGSAVCQDEGDERCERTE